jgi:hypothetical protein
MTNLWALMSARWLSFGRIITSPAHDNLLRASKNHLARRATLRKDRRATQMLASAAGAAPPSGNPDQERRRVLDLGGQPIGMFISSRILKYIMLISSSSGLGLALCLGLS